MLRTLGEALLVVSVGAALAFAANGAREKGLLPGRDYFPSNAASAAAGSSTAPVSGTGAGPAVRGGSPATVEHSAASEDASLGQPPIDPHGTPAPSAPDGARSDEHHPPDAADPELAPIIARLEEKGLRAIDHASFVALTEDPLAAAGAYLFVDARRAEQFAEGHIPGAVHLDPFYPEGGLSAVLLQLPVAQRIVVYCNGGQCDDSESAAIMLLQFGADPGKLTVYVGGITAWQAAGLPLEEG